MSLEHYLFAAVIILIAYFIRGIAGFGSGLIAVPLLALFLPLTLVVPLILLLDFTASLVVSGLNLERVKWREILWLIPFSITGVIVGSQLLVGLPATPMLIALALFVFVFAIRILLNIHGDKLASTLWAIPSGFIGGMVGSLFGTGGPPYIIYLTHRIHDKSLLRATLSALFFLDGILRMISFFATGLLLSQLVWWSALGALPIMLASLYAGGHVHTGFSQTQMTRFIGILLVLSSLSLLFKAVA